MTWHETYLKLSAWASALRGTKGASREAVLEAALADVSHRLGQAQGEILILQSEISQLRNLGSMPAIDDACCRIGEHGKYDALILILSRHEAGKQPGIAVRTWSPGAEVMELRTALAVLDAGRTDLHKAWLSKLSTEGTA